MEHDAGLQDFITERLTCTQYQQLASGDSRICFQSGVPTGAKQSTPLCSAGCCAAAEACHHVAFGHRPSMLHWRFECQLPQIVQGTDLSLCTSLGATPKHSGYTETGHSLAAFEAPSRTVSMAGKPHLMARRYHKLVRADHSRVPDSAILCEISYLTPKIFPNGHRYWQSTPF